MRSVAGIARWSVRRPWSAVDLSLLFVAVTAALGITTGIKSLQNGAVGESARECELIDEHQAYTPRTRVGFVHSDTLTADDPHLNPLCPTCALA